MGRLRDKPSAFDEHIEFIANLCTEGATSQGIIDKLNESTDKVFNLHSLNSFFRNRKPELNEIRLRVRAGLAKKDIRSVSKMVPESDIEVMVNAASDANPFIAELREKHGSPDKVCDDAFNDPYNVGYQSFVVCCRCVMVFQNRNAHITDIRHAQAVYENAITFLQNLEKAEGALSRNLNVSINPNADTTPEQLSAFMGAISEANRAIADAKAKRRGEQPELFTEGELP